jgi:hypothetical protein
MPEGKEVDAIVGLPQDGPGKQVGVKEVKRADDSTVERQETVTADASDPNATQSVRGERGRGRAASFDAAVLSELQAIHKTLDHIRDLLLQAL